MKLTWYGHACFKLETALGSLVFDPYQAGSVPGLTPPPLEADAVVCSHQHSDHCYVEGVTLTGRKPEFGIRQVSSFHETEQGRRWGSNQITIVSVGDKTLAHLGDLGHLLSDEQIAAVGPLDVLLVPVGGFYTLDADDAFQVTMQLKPRVIVPMHYRQGDAGLTNISELSPFLAHFESERIVYAQSSCCEPDTFPAGSVLVYPWPETGE